MPAIARCTSQRPGQREQACDLLQALRIGQALLGQRLEGAHLGVGGGHARDARRDGTQLSRRRPAVDGAGRPARSRHRRRGNSSMRERCVRGPPCLPRHASTAECATLPGRAAPVASSCCARPAFAVLMGRADEIDLVLAQAATGHAIRDHAHELGLLLRGRQPAEGARQRHHAGLHRGFVGVARELEVAVARAAVAFDRSRAPRPPRARAAAPGRSRRRNARDDRGTCAPRSCRAAAPRA